MVLLLLYSLLCLPLIEAFGFDSANTCGPNGKISRRGRAQILAAIPCDLTQQPYCEKAGHAYPWHAVRRFVHENQGLMKRMYGDVLHISVLRDEIQNNEIEDDDIEVTAARYSAEGQRRSSKFMHEPEEYTKQTGGVLEEPHFRPLLNSSVNTMKADNEEGNQQVSGEELKGALNISERKSTRRNRPTEGTRYHTYFNARRRNRTSTTTTTSTTESSLQNTDPALETAVLEAIKLLNADGANKLQVAHNDDSNLQSNSVYEIPQTTVEGENIKIIESPKLNERGTLQNLTQQLSTISSTLKVASTLKPHHFYTRRRPTSTPQQQQQIYKITSNVGKESVLNSKVQSKESERISSIQPSLTAKRTTTSTLSTAAPLTTITTTTTTTTISVKGDNNNITTHQTVPPTKPLINQGVNEQTTSSTTSTTETAAAEIPETKTTVSTSSPSMLPLRVNGELVSNHYNNKQRKPPTSTTTPSTSNQQDSTTSTITTMTTKPILRDGQLFQDTLKQETPILPPPPPPASQPSTLTNLRGINACPVKEEVVAPFWANNTRGEILALLNMYPFEQYVHWEKCTHEHKQMYCRDGCRCEQQYRLHRLLAYDPHNECRGIFSDWFRFPSCCICKCYNIQLDVRATSRSPRSEQMSIIDEPQNSHDRLHSIDRAEQQVKEAIYEHATEEWYRPADDYAYDYADDNGDI